MMKERWFHCGKGKATIKGCNDDIKVLILNDGLDQTRLLKQSAINSFNKVQ